MVLNRLTLSFLITYSQRTLMSFIICLLITAFLCSLPMGLGIGMIMYNTDPRQHKSGNTGMSNVWRCCGPTAGVLTLVGDSAKAFVTLWMCSSLSDSVFMIGFLCVFFHCYSIYLKGNGGKGVATASGVILYFSIEVFFVAIVSWGLLRWRSKKASVASLGTVAITLLHTFFRYDELTFFIFAISILICIRHKDNILRLLSKEELHF